MQFKLLKNKKKLQQNTVLKSQKNNKKSQEKSRGRSMVEMLGVLAIIGVLSIGGISGYTIAMRRYRANEVANLIIKYASISYLGIQTRMNTTGDVILSPNESYAPEYLCYYKNKPDHYNPGVSSYDTDETDVSDGTDFDIGGYYSPCASHPFTDVGLGGLPNGVESLDIINMLAPNHASGSNSYYERVIKMKPGNYADMVVIFTDKALCETVAHLFDGYKNSDGEDGVACDVYGGGSFRKLIPVE